MKILGNDGKIYSTVKEAKEADARFEAQQNLSVQEVEQSKKPSVNERKELSSKIDAARKKYDEAVANYAKLKKESENIIREANKKAYAMLLEGAKEVEKYSNEHMNLIKEFNTKFERPFTIFYTGKDAEEQYNKRLQQFAEIFDLPFSKLF